MKIAAILVSFAIVAVGAVSMTYLFVRSGEDLSVIEPPPADAFLERVFPSEIREGKENPPSPVSRTSENSDELSSNETASYVPLRDGVCAGAKTNDFNCYDEYYSNLTRQKGISAAFADLRTRYPQESYIRSQCHPLTHVIGRVAVEYANDVADIFVLGDPYCWSGYYHGAMEGIIGKIGRSNIPDRIDGICSSIGGKQRYSFDHYNCVHGLGHGVMAVNDNELFDSLEVCDNIIGTWERSSCWSGAFMENVIVDGKNHFTKYLKPEEPLYPCNAVEERQKTTCYLMQTSYMLKVTQGNFAKVFELCTKADKGFENTCYQSLGRDASGRSVSDVARTKATCDLGANQEQQLNCIIGAVKDFVSYLHDDARAKELCNAYTDLALREPCLLTVAEYYKSF